MSKFAEQQPKDGDVILRCAHRNRDRYHWFKTPETEFTRPDGSKGASKWICICDVCFSKVDDPFDAVADDAIWMGDEPAIREDKPI